MSQFLVVFLIIYFEMSLLCIVYVYVLGCSTYFPYVKLLHFVIHIKVVTILNFPQVEPLFTLPQQHILNRTNYEQLGGCI